MILVLTTEPLPIPGSPTTGAGLRAWGLAEGLRSRGLDVIVATPLYAGQEAPAEPLADAFSHVRFFKRPQIHTLLATEKPDVVVLQHWGLASEVPELTVPLAIDLAGPHLLERAYWGNTDPGRDLREKLTALARADFVTCSGTFQRHYFLGFLVAAGYEPDAMELPVIPYSVPPRDWEPGLNAVADVSDSNSSASGEEPVFIYGGAFLAWQDPTRPLQWLLDELERAGRGRLHFYGGSHPVLDASGGRFAELTSLLAGHPRVVMQPFLPFDRLLNEYRRGTVAVDLMERNPERELAFTTRTMIYFFCGLPTIHNDYSEISGLIREHGCGWTLDPRDEKGFRDAVRSVLDGSAPLPAMRAGAAGLADRYAWDKTIEPLAQFCSAPHLRAGKELQVAAIETRTRELETAHAECRALRQELDSMRGKVAFRVHRFLGRFAFLLAPFAWIAGWIAAAWLWLKFRSTLHSASRDVPDRTRKN